MKLAPEAQQSLGLWDKCATHVGQTRHIYETRMSRGSTFARVEARPVPRIIIEDPCRDCRSLASETVSTICAKNGGWGPWRVRKFLVLR